MALILARTLGIAAGLALAAVLIASLALGASETTDLFLAMGGIR